MSQTLQHQVKPSTDVSLPVQSESQLQRRAFPHEVESQTDKAIAPPKAISADWQAQQEKIARARFNPGMISLYPANPLKDEKEKPVQRKVDSIVESDETQTKPIQRRVESPPEADEGQAESIQRKTESTAQDELEKDKPSSNKLVQTKLSVGKVGDRYEQEADQVAAKVMTMPDPSRNRIQRQTEDADIQPKSLANTITPLVQRQSDEEVQTKSGGDRNAQNQSVNAEFENRLAVSKASGSPLSSEVRSFMEPRFGVNLSHVRVHTGADSAQLNKDVQAQAFTYKQDIYFAAGRSPDNDDLTAHELTHVVQQTGATNYQPEHNAKQTTETKTGNQADNQFVSQQTRDRKEQKNERKVVTRNQATADIAKAKSTRIETNSAVQEARKAAIGATDKGIERAKDSQNSATHPKENPEKASRKNATVARENTQRTTDKTRDNNAQEAVTGSIDTKKKASGEKGKATKDTQKTKVGSDKAAPSSQKLSENKPQFVQPVVKSTFATTEQGIDMLQPREILGPTQDGLILYQTDRPEQSLALARTGIPVRPIRKERAAIVREKQRRQSEAAIAQFMKSGSQRVARITASGKTIKPRIQGAAGQAKAAIQAALIRNRSAIISGIARSRSQAQSQAQSARSQVTQQHSATASAIRVATTAARQRLQAGYQNSLARLDQIESGMAARIAVPFDQAAEDFRAAGDKVGQGAIQIGADFQNQYANESPPEPSNAVTEFLESFDRDIYVSNWRQAKKDAARDLAANYRDGLVVDAGDKATQLKDNMPPVLQGMQEVVTTTRSSLQTKHTAALQQLNQSEQQSLQTARTTLTTQLQGINQGLRSTLASLQQLQATQLRQLNQTAHQQKQGIDRHAQQITVALNKQVKQAGKHLQNAFQTFGKQARQQQSPNPQVVKSVIAEAKVQLDKLMTTTSAELETGIGNAVQGVSKQGQQAVGSLNQFGQKGAASGTTVTQEFSGSMAQTVQSANQVFTQLRTGHTTTVNTSVDRTVSEFGQMTSGVEQQLNGVIQNLNTELGRSAGELETGLKGSLGSLRTEIPTKAQEAADQVQPAWKQIAKVLVDVIITVVVTVAIAALVASGVGIIAAIGLAALIGAAGALVKQGANDLIDGRMSSWQTYATQAGFGAVSGVLQLVGLRGADKLAGAFTNRIASNAARMGMETLGETGADVSQRLATGEEFSLALLGKSAGTSLLGNAGGQALTSSFGRLGNRMGAANVDSRALRSGGNFAAETTSETAIDVTSQVTFEGQDLSWSTIGQSAATSALGTAAGRGAQRGFGDRLSNWRRGDQPSTNVPTPSQAGRPQIDPTLNQSGSSARNTTPNQLVNTQGRPASNTPINRTPPPIRQDDTSTPTRPTAHRLDNLTTPRQEITPDRPINDTRDRTPENNRTTPDKTPETDPNLTAALPRDLQGRVPIQVDPDLPGNTVRVHYEVDANGLVTNVHMRTGPDANAVDVQLHVQTVRLMERYSGFSGRIRVLRDRLQNWIGRNGTPPVGSRAWEAQMEVEKLPRIINERLERLSRGNLDPETEANLRADIDNLQQQLDRHQQTLDEMDTDPGVGFVAAEGTNLPLLDHNGRPIGASPDLRTENLPLLDHNGRPIRESPDLRTENLPLLDHNGRPIRESPDLRTENLPLLDHNGRPIRESPDLRTERDEVLQDRAERGDPVAEAELAYRRLVYDKHLEVQREPIRDWLLERNRSLGSFPPPTPRTVQASRQVMSLLEQAKQPSNRSFTVNVTEVRDSDGKIKFIVSLSGAKSKVEPMSTLLGNKLLKDEKSEFELAPYEIDNYDRSAPRGPDGQPLKVGENCAEPKSFSKRESREVLGVVSFWFGRPNMGKHRLPGVPPTADPTFVEKNGGHGTYMLPCPSCELNSGGMMTGTAYQSTTQNDETLS